MKSKVISRLLIWLLPALAIMLAAVVGFGMIVFVDPDLDVVTEMDYFIGSYCGWDYIS